MCLQGLSEPPTENGGSAKKKRSSQVILQWHSCMGMFTCERLNAKFSFRIICLFNLYFFVGFFIWHFCIFYPWNNSQNCSLISTLFHVLDLIYNLTSDFLEYSKLKNILKCNKLILVPLSSLYLYILMHIKQYIYVFIYIFAARNKTIFIIISQKRVSWYYGFVSASASALGVTAITSKVL